MKKKNEMPSYKIFWGSRKIAIEYIKVTEILMHTSQNEFGHPWYFTIQTITTMYSEKTR